MPARQKGDNTSGERAAGPRVGRLLFTRLRVPIALAITLVVVATLFYFVFEGFGIVDALYMTVITMSTVGFAEVHPLDTSARIATIVVIALGFGIVAYSAAIIGDLFLSGEMHRAFAIRRRQRLQQGLSNHVIVAGYGRVGQAATRELLRQGETVLVLDRDESRADSAQAAGAVFALGDGTDENDLKAVGIERARALVVSAQDDPTNLVVVLTARALVPGLRVISRVGFAEWRNRILRAGADVAISPYDTVGKSLAATALSPDIIDLHDLPLLGLRNEEVVVGGDSPLIDREVADIAASYPSVLILALRRDATTHLYSEAPGAVRAGDVLVILGPPDELLEVSRVLSSKTASRPERT